MSHFKKIILILLSISLISIFSLPANSAIPNQINYQGRLTDNAGSPVPNGLYGITFSIYNDINELQWNEIQSDVLIINGIFNVLLPGNPGVGSFPDGLFNESLYIGIQVGTDDEMTPLQPLTSVPFAFKAEDADTLQGHGPDSFVSIESDPTVESSVKDGVSWDELSDIPPDIADGDNDSGGDITAIIAEAGLVGGGFAGEIPLAVNFAGSGVDLMAAHSDHHHDGIYAPEIHGHDADNISTGMLDPERFSAIDDLMVEGHLNNDSGTDLLLKDQADANYWRLGGNFGIGLVFGTLELQPLELRVHNQHALRLEPGTTPNLIGGFAGNFASNGVIGATISGGGQDVYTNRVTDSFGTVGGGAENQAGNGDFDNYNRYATVSGGTGNTASGGGATVGGGWTNTASGGEATIGGGEDNIASGADATVSGGESNTASGGGATVGGGYLNTASDFAATVGGGTENNATNYSTVGGGRYNNANGIYSTIPGGIGGKTNNWGQLAYASGGFSGVAGSAQTSVYVLRNTNSGTENVELFLDGDAVGRRIIMENGRTMTFNIMVVVRSDGGHSAGYKIEGIIENYNGTVAMVGTPTAVPLGEDIGSLFASVWADDINKALAIGGGGGISGINTRWVARVETAEVYF